MALACAHIDVMYPPLANHIMCVLPACMTAALMQGFVQQHPQWDPASGVECTVQFGIPVSSRVLVGSNLGGWPTCTRVVGWQVHTALNRYYIVLS